VGSTQPSGAAGIEISSNAVWGPLASFLVVWLFSSIGTGGGGAPRKVDRAVWVEVGR
jgi:hypothetical protein